MAQSSGVYVVLSTYNGARYVVALIESVRRQTFRDWRLLVRDDGSSDATLEIVAELARQDPRISLLPPDGRNLRAPGSFGALLAAAREQGAGYVFLADQDDVWLEGKLDRLLAAMADAEARAGVGVPVLVYSDLAVVADDLRVIHPSFRRQQRLPPPGEAALHTLLTQNVVTGCASLLNRALLDVVVPLPESLAMHDWWIAQCAAATGRIVAVDEPTVLYRQHASNVVGAKGALALIGTALRRPRRWWARGVRGFFLGLRQAEALGRRLHERPLTAHGKASQELVARYCRAFAPAAAAPLERLRTIRRLGPRPITRIPRLLYYVRVVLYGRLCRTSPGSEATTG